MRSLSHLVVGTVTSRPRATAAFLAVLALLPQVNKAFEIDDPLFLWGAQQVVRDPYEAFAAQCNWWNTVQPLAVVHNHPPGQSLYLAIIGWALGWDEVPFRLAMLVPAVLLVVGIVELSCDLGHSPRASLLAAAWVATCPGYVVCMASVMAEPWLLASWVWAVIVWRRGIVANHVGLCWAGAVLATVAVCVKFSGICLTPLLLLFGWVSGIRRMAILASCAVPAVVLIALDLCLRSSTADSILQIIASYALTSSPYAGAGRVIRAAMTPGFLGGACIFVLPFCVLFIQRSGAATRLALCMAGVLAVCGLSLGMDMPRTITAFDAVTVGQWAVMTVAGCIVLWEGGVAVWSDQPADGLLLASWVIGVTAFAGVVNWTLNIRSVLPAVPAAAILLAGHLDRLGWACGSRKRFFVTASLVINALLGLSVGLGDYANAAADRRAVDELKAGHVMSSRRVYFLGHWGFQWYMQQAGGIAVDVSDFCMEASDVVVVPLGNTNVVPGLPPADCAQLRTKLSIPVQAWCAVTDSSRHAGFHAWELGWLPYRLGSVKEKEYLVFEMTGRFVSPKNQGVPCQ